MNRRTVTRTTLALLSFLASLLGAAQITSANSFTPNGGSSSVDTGAFRYQLPIELPPLPGHLQFDLAVGYSDRVEAGLFGSRTDLLGLPQIRRCASSESLGDSESKPVTMTQSDRLCLDGNPLRSISGDYWASGTIYRTASESYSRITAEPGGFKVEYKNGNIAFLTHQVFLSNDSRVYAWYAEQIQDRYDNEITIDYKETETFDGLSLDLSEALPESISYRNTLISFTYEDGVDIERYYGLMKGTIRKNKVIDEIKISIADKPVRKYEFLYSGTAVPSKNLESVTECGVEELNSTNWLCANSVAFSWEQYSKTFDSQVQQSVTRELTSGDGRWLVNVFKGDWNGDGISDVITVSASGRVVVHEGGPNNGSNLEPRQLLSAQSNISGTILDVRTAFVIGDVNHDGREDIIFAEGVFDTNSLSGTHDWYILLAQPDGSSIKRKLGEVPSTTVTMNNGGPNETDFFFNFYNNIAIGIKPIIADLNGDKFNEVVFPERTSSASDSFSWIKYSSTSNDSTSTIALTKNGAVPNVDVTDYTLNVSVNVVDNGASQILFIGDDAVNNAWKLYSEDEGLSHLYQMQSAMDAECKPYFLDIHGDKLTDIVFDCGESAQLFVADGTDWVRENSHISGLGSYLSSGKGGPQVGDIDGSGVDRFLVPPSSASGTWRSVVIKKDGSYRTSDTNLPYTLTSTDIDNPDSPYADFINIIINGMDRRNQAVQIGDFTGNGIPDFIQANGSTNRWDLYGSDRENVYGIQTVQDNYGNLTSISRTSLADSAVYDSATPTADGFREAPLSISVVEEIQKPDGRGGNRSITYKYEGAKHNYLDLGFTGFDRIIRSDSATGLSTHTHFEQEHTDYSWMLNGRPKLTETYWEQGGTPGPISIRSVDWSVYSITSETQLAYRYEEVTAELDGNYSVASITEVNYDIDGDSGVPKKTTTKVGNGILVDGLPSLSHVSHQRIVEQTNIISDTSQWLLGFVGNVRETLTAYNSNGIDEKVMETSYLQWPGTLDVESKTVFPGDMDLTSTESYQYDSFGNVSLKKVDGNSNFISREWTYSDFVSGQYPATEMAPLGAGYSNIEYDLRYGKRTQETGPNGLTREQKFDVFGRLIKSVSRAGVVTDYIYELCNGGCAIPGQSDHEPWYSVTQQVTHPQNPKLGEPTVTEFFDSLGRKVGISKIAFDGEPVHQIWKYDAAGREVFVSRPYKGSAPTAYTTYSNFDFAGRAQHKKTHTVADGVINHEERSYVYLNPGVELSVDALAKTENGGEQTFHNFSKTIMDSRGEITQTEEGMRWTHSVGQPDGVPKL